MFIKCAMKMPKNKISSSFLASPKKTYHCFATLSENVTITSDAFIDLSFYFDMSNLSFAA